VLLNYFRFWDFFQWQFWVFQNFWAWPLGSSHF